MRQKVVSGKAKKIPEDSLLLVVRFPNPPFMYIVREAAVLEDRGRHLSGHDHDEMFPVRTGFVSAFQCTNTVQFDMELR
jgi:hypothetical protein